LTRKLKNYLRPSEIIRLELKGSFGRLVVSEDGKKQLQNAATKLGVPFKSIIQKILAQSV
jgi:hypothetical protein